MALAAGASKWLVWKLRIFNFLRSQFKHFNYYNTTQDASKCPVCPQ